MKSLKIIPLFILSMILFTVSSCENEPLDGSFAGVNNPNGGGTSGGGSGGGSTGGGSGGGTSTGDYWPMALDNIWNYDINFDNNPPETSAVEIDDTVIYQGESQFRYSQFFSSDIATNGTGINGLQAENYTRKDNGDYHVSIGDIDADYLNGAFVLNQTGYSIILLKDYFDIGATWSSSNQTTTTFTSNTPGLPDLPTVIQDLNHSFEIDDKLASFTVNGTTYNDIIKVKYTLVTSSVAGNATIETYYYFALDIGVVKVEFSQTGANGISNGTYELDSYTLN